MSSAALEYQKAHWNEDQGPGIIAASGILIALTTIAVALRLWAQSMIKAKFSVDDYLIIIAWILSVGLCVTVIMCVNYGIGQHLIRAIETDGHPPDRLVTLFKYIFVEGLLWALDTPLIKIAILIFYRRVFTGNLTWFVWAFWGMIIYSIAWGIATFVVVMLQCTPLPFFWLRAYAFYKMEPPTIGTCLDTRASQVPPSLLNCFGDLVLLMLPFPVLWTLQMNLKRKLEIMFIFGVGAFVLASSVVRLRYIWLDENSSDPTYDNAGTLIWTPIECCVGVICACIPCMAPLRQYVSKKKQGPTGYRMTTGGGGTYSKRSRTAHTPLASLSAWPRDHRAILHSHPELENEGDDYGEAWASRYKNPNVSSDLESDAGMHEAYASKPTVVTDAWAEPQTPGDKAEEETTPSNHIKVSKNVEWSSDEQPHAR